MELSVKIKFKIELDNPQQYQLTNKMHGQLRFGSNSDSNLKNALDYYFF